AKLQNHPLARLESERSARERCLDGPEFLGIEAARNDDDLALLRAIERHEVVKVLRTLRDDGVGFVHDSALDGAALIGKAVGLALMQAAHAAQGVKRYDERHAERVLEV